MHGRGELQTSTVKTELPHDNATDPGKPPEDLGRSHDLLLKAQLIGRTGYVISDIRTQRVYWSDSLFELRSFPKRPYFTREEALNVIHPEDRPKFVAARDASFASRAPFSLEVRIVNGRGEICWEEYLSQPQFDAEGNITGLLTVTRDITDKKQNAITLQQQEATYRTLFDGMGDAIVLVNDGVIEDCNISALDMFRCTREQIVGKTPVAISPEVQPDGMRSSEKAREKIEAALHGERQLFEWRHRRFDGSDVDTEVTLNRVGIAGSTYFFGIVRDITERKQTEAALKTSYEKFEGAFQHSADSLWVSTLGDDPWSGIVVDINQSAERLFRAPRDQLIGKPFTTFEGNIPSFPIDEYRELMNTVGYVRDLPLRVDRPDGNPIHLLISGSRFYVGDAPHTLSVLRDVTQRVESEERIRELNDSLNVSLRQLRDITDNLPVLISYQDTEGRFRFINKTGAQWLGASAESLLGKTVLETMPQDYIDATRGIRAQRARRTNAHVRGELTAPFPDGITRTVDANFIPDLDETGVWRGTYTVTADITERKETEEQLRQSQKMQAIGKLTGGVAHDFNNLLAVILGNLELANDRLKDGDENVRKLLAPALRAAERGATLTRSLLAFARQQPLEPTIIDLTALMRDMTNLLRRAVPENIEIEFVSSAGLWKSEADPGQLQNALLNLVVNARDAMPDGGKLTIETGNVRLDDEYADGHEEVEAGQYVMLAVSDTGVGMAPDVIARAFEPFYTTKGLGQGTGLGLSMVYGFAKQSGGHVTIYSEQGHGTTVRIYLPRWAGKPDAAAASKSAAALSIGNERVLVVEDDDDVRFITVTILRSLGYEVQEASSGRAALDLLKSAAPFNLLVTDVVLTGPLNGKKVAVEALAMHPGLRVLYMSGYTENAIVHHGRLDQGVHFIQKPFRKQDLAAKVRGALDAPPA